MSYEHKDLPLADLVIDEANARHDSKPDDGIDTLAASIGAVGLLQPILVVKRGDGYGIVAGRRRFLAVLKLTGQENTFATDLTGTIAAVVIDEAQARDASLAENYVRMAMDTKELYGAFKALADAGRTEQEIADQLGYELPRVRRILRLSALHPDLMDCWNEGNMGEAEAHAFAFVEDQDLQMRVAKKVRKDYGYGPKDELRFRNMAHMIKRGLKDALKGKDFDQRKLAYIGIEAYKEAGGRLHEDLFGDDIVILDPKLVETLGDAKLAAEQAEALKLMRRHDGSDLNVEWVETDALPQINLYGYNQVDEDCRISPEIEGKGEDARAVLPVGGKILAEAFFTVEGESGYKLYWASRADGGIPEPKQKNQKATASASSDVKQSPGQLLKAASGAPSRNGFFALQVMFADMVASSLLADATETVGKTEDEGLYNFLFLMGWSLSRVSSVSGFPRLHEPERGPHQVREILKDADHGNRLLISALPDATWLEAKTLEESYDAFWGWIGTKNAARLGAALLGRTWSPIVNNFSEQEQPKIVGLVASHGYGDLDAIEWTSDFTEQQLLAIDIISHKARLAAMESWGVPADQLKPLRKATSGDFMKKILTDDGRRKLLGMDDAQFLKARSWLPEPLRLPAPPKPKAEKPKVKAKAKTKVKAREVEPA